MGLVIRGTVVPSCEVSNLALRACLACRAKKIEFEAAPARCAPGMAVSDGYKRCAGWARDDRVEIDISKSVRWFAVAVVVPVKA